MERVEQERVGGAVHEIKMCVSSQDLSNYCRRNKEIF
jgi:hypothetical protein